MYPGSRLRFIVHISAISAVFERDPSQPVAQNLLQQGFTAEAPNQRWASDIPYLLTHQGWLYLAAVMDLYSRRIVGWSMSRWISRHLVMDALSMAIGSRRPESAMIHHSDSENVAAGSFW